MSTRVYTLPVDQTQWQIAGDATTVFNWEYDETRDRLLTLYEKGKEKQWNTNTRIDWTIDVEPGSPDNYPDFYIPIYGSDVWERMTEKERQDFRQHSAAWTNSQFLHGEQGALVCTAKIVQTVPDVDCKFYAATQVMDEGEEFIVYATYVMRDRFLAEEMYENVGLPVEECMTWVRVSEMLGEFRKMLFSRIVPTVKDLGLFGPKVRAAFEDMGVIGFGELKPDDLAAADEQVADELDRRRQDETAGGLADVDPARAREVEETIDAGRE